MQKPGNRTIRDRNRVTKERQGAIPKPGINEVASYVCDYVRGIRALTRDARQRDVRFLDYLLAMAETEAEKLAGSTYH